MRMKTFGAATSAALAAAAMLAVPATANADEVPSIDFDSPVTLDVDRDENGDVWITIDNPTESALQCSMVIGDANLVSTVYGILKVSGVSFEELLSPADQAIFDAAKEQSPLFGFGFPAVDGADSVTHEVQMNLDDHTTQPEGIASCHGDSTRIVIATTTETTPDVPDEDEDDGDDDGGMLSGINIDEILAMFGPFAGSLGSLATFAQDGIPGLGA